MKFEQALELMRQGEKIRLSTWPSHFYLFIEEQENEVFHDGNQKLRWHSAHKDILNDSWEIFK